MVEKQGWQANRLSSQQVFQSRRACRPEVLAGKQDGRNIRQQVRQACRLAGKAGRQARGAGWPAELADQQV